MTIDNPCVSIIINCYNGEKYLKEALNSILNQTYENWEIIFWDNQSSDLSAKIFKSYKDKRFKYFYSENHTSLYKARNLAIEKSSYDFIAFLDTDDLWERNKLELQMPHFDNKEIGLVFSNFWLLKGNNNKKKLYINKTLPSGKIYNDLINNYCVGILTTIIRKKSYQNLDKVFDDRFSIIGDFDLFLRLAKENSFASIQEPLAYYRLHGQNFSTLNKAKEVTEFKTWIEENKSYLSNMQINKMQKDIDYKRFLNSKIDGKFKESINILFKSKISLFNLKNLFLLLMPVNVLKKFLWFYNDPN